jgi:hypothetical protein
MIRMYAFDVPWSSWTRPYPASAAVRRVLPVGEQREDAAELLDARTRFLGSAEEHLLEHEPVEGGEYQSREAALAIDADRPQLTLDQRHVLVVDGAKLGQHLGPTTGLESHLVLEYLLVLRCGDGLGQPATEILHSGRRTLQEREGDRRTERVLQGLLNQGVPRSEVMRHEPVRDAGLVGYLTVGESPKALAGYDAHGRIYEGLTTGAVGG